MTFWANNLDKFPLLSLIARNLLQIPATSASSQRYLSQGALIINKLRNRLSKEAFELIISLESWGMFQGITEKEIINKEEDMFVID